MPNLVNGLGGSVGFGEQSLARNDDGSSQAINITSLFGPSGLNFFGTNYTSLFVNNNGNITFGGSLSSYTPSPIGVGLGIPIIAPYWMDIDTRNLSGLPLVSPGGTSQGTNLVYYDLDVSTRTFTATWDDVGYYSNHNTPSNAFQLRLVDQGAGNFDIIFIYENIQRATADLAGIARAGYSPGGGRPGGFELPGSGDVNSILQVDTNNGNTGTPGYWVFQVRGGQVSGGTAPAEIIPTRPVTFSVETIGLRHEGNSGLTPFDVVIRRGGGDLGLPSIVHWQIVINDPADLAPGQALSGVVEFAPYVSEIPVSVSAVGDRVFEDDDMIRFQLTEVSFGAEVWNPGVEGAAIIVNDDPRTGFAFAGDQIRAEGQVGTTPFEFIVIRSGDISATSVVEWRLDTGATNALDFNPNQQLTGTATFGPGQTQAVITIDVVGDNRIELDEIYTIQLTTATTLGVVTNPNVIASGTILDDDLRQTVLVGSPTAMVLPEGDQGQTSFQFTLVRVGDTALALQLPFVVNLPAAGGVSASEILSPLSGLLSFAAGSSQASLEILIQGDNLPEANETFLISVGGVAGLNRVQLTGVVLNDDKVAPVNGVIGEANSAPEVYEVSSFVERLAGGGLWSDAGLI